MIRRIGHPEMRYIEKPPPLRKIVIERDSNRNSDSAEGKNPISTSLDIHPSLLETGPQSNAAASQSLDQHSACPFQRFDKSI
jgi:hypothetical protein